MTIFSDPVSPPWTRMTPDNPSSGTQVQQQGIRISPDVALFGYGEKAYVNLTTDTVNYGVATGTTTLVAVRHTDEGPVMGPALELPNPVVDKPHFLEALMAGATDGQAWILTNVEDYAAGGYFRLGRVMVDPTTLSIAVQWMGWKLPNISRGHGYVFADVWLAQNLLVLANMNAVDGVGKERAAQLVNIETGAVVARVALPLGYGTTGVYVQGFALHPDRQEMLVAGTRVTGGYDRPTLWTAPLTPTSIGAWTRVEIPTEANYADGIYIDTITAHPVSSTQYQVAAIWTRDNGYLRPYYYGSQKVRNYSFTPPSSLVEHPILLSEKGHYDSQMGARPVQMDMRDNQLVVAVVETSDRATETMPAGTTGGVKHIEMSADRTQPAATVTLPKTENIIGESGNVTVVALGAARYLYLVSGWAITVPFVNRTTSMQFLIYAGGPTMKPPFVPGIKGEAPEENRRAFRRVN